MDAQHDERRALLDDELAAVDQGLQLFLGFSAEP
jgi:hypothetical protein